MRIVIVTNLLPPHGRGGAEAYSARIAEALGADHDVLVLTGSPGGAIANAEVRMLPSLPDLGHDAAILHKLWWHARDQWLPRVHREIGRQFARFRPDVVHTNAVQGLSAAPFSAVAAAGLPHVHTAHDLSLLCARVTMTKNGEFCGGRCATCRIQRVIRGTTLARRLTTFVAVSEYIRHRHVAAGVVHEGNSTVLRLGADVLGARVRTIDRDGIHIGFLGALAPHKGVRTLLRMFASAPPGWHLSIAGAGRLEQEVEAAADGQANLRFLGHVSGAEKRRFFDEIDLLVVPSEWEEPAALVGIEAAAQGVPVVATDRGGIPELPEARVVQAGNEQSLREGIDWFASDPERFRATSERLIARAQELSWETHVEKLKAILVRAASQEETR